MRVGKAIMCVAGIVSTASAMAAPTGLTDDRNARDLTFATEWFEGEFDNDLQIWFETDPRSHTAPEERHQRSHAVHTRLPDTLLGAAAFLVREYQDDDRTKLVSEHVVSLQSNKPEEGIRLRYHRLLGDVAPTGLTTASQLEAMIGCDVILRRRGVQLEGRVQKGGCASGAGKSRSVIDETIWLGPNVYSRERIEISPKKPGASTDADLGPVHFYKARGFDCAANMFADSYLKPSTNDKHYKFEGRHDLGDVMLVESPRDGKRYQLQLRRQRYPYYQSGGEFLLMRLREVGAPTSVAIVTSDTGNDNISLNLGWAMISCNARQP